NADTGSPYGGDYYVLNMVRSLGEGPAAGNRIPATTDLTASAKTAVGGTVLTFASVPSTIVPFMWVTGVTQPSSIPFNTVVGTVTATTITIVNRTIASPGITTGDVIRFWGSGLVTPGNNLRVTATFARSGTLSFSFVRSLTLHTSGGLSTTLLIADTGRFYPTDVGKPIKLVGAAAYGWTNTFGYISRYIDSTHIEYVIQPAQANWPSFSGTAQIGANEPDANYVVTGLCGDAGETFWVTGISTTGFTLHSSNAASTANVVALIVR